MTDTVALAEAALERLRSIMARWPRPGAGQGVRADATRAGLAPLGPIAEMVLTLPVGYGKGYYPGVGYLSGSSRITDADLKLARAVEQDLNVILPAAEARPLTRQLYGQIKKRAYQLLGLAVDLDVTQGNLAKLGTAPGAAWDRWVSLAKVEPIVNVGAAADAADVGQTGDVHVDRAIATLVRWLDGEGARPDDARVRGERLLLVYAPGRVDALVKARSLAPPTIASKRLGGSAITLQVAVVAVDDPTAVGRARTIANPRGCVGRHFKRVEPGAYVDGDVYRIDEFVPDSDDGPAGFAARLIVVGPNSTTVRGSALDLTVDAMVEMLDVGKLAWCDVGGALADPPAFVAVGAVAGWVAPRFRDATGVEWRWTGERGLDDVGRHVQVLRSARGATMRLAREDVEALVREGELLPLAPAVEAGQGVPGQKPVDSPMAAKAEAAVQRVLRFTRAWPHPTGTQRVTVQSAQVALAPLRPLAERIAALAIGTKKGTIAGSDVPETLFKTIPFWGQLYMIVEAVEGKPQAGTGYLSGSKFITEADRATARFILNTIDATLPLYTAPVLEPADYEEIRKQSHRLLMIATDLDLDTTLVDKVSLAWVSVKESVRDLASKAAGYGKEGFDVLKTLLIIGAVGVGIYGVSMLRGAPATRVVVAAPERR